MASAGLELLYASVQSQIRTPHDAVMCCLHWGMVQNGFKCVGTGEQEPAKDAKKSELLPAGWNASPDMYSLVYQDASGNNHLLKVIPMDESMLVHVLRMRDDTVADVTVAVEEYTTSDLSSFDSAIKHGDNILKKFKTEVLDTFNKPAKKPAETQSGPRPQPQRPPNNDPLRVPPRHGHRQPLPDWAGSSDPFSIGRGDLDPLAAGRGGGGMLFDPYRGGFPGVRPDPSAGLPGRLPPGAVPPGARFDPFGPPGTGRGRHGPDPDHEPPGYGDMFM